MKSQVCSFLCGHDRKADGIVGEQPYNYYRKLREITEAWNVEYSSIVSHKKC